MRTVALSVSFTFLCALPVFGQQVGELIIVKSEVAELRSEKQTTARVNKGLTLVVQKVNGDWFWVTANFANGSAKGWIHRKDVIPFSQGLELFNEEVRRQPTAAAYTLRGKYLHVQRKLDKAIDDFNAALKLDPKFIEARGRRGWAYLDKFDYDAAISDFSEVIGADPNNAKAFYFRGIAWFRKEDNDKAIADFNEALRLDPQNPDSYNSRGQAWQAKGEQDKAIADFTEAMRLEPNNDRHLGDRAQAWKAKGEFGKAIDDYQQIVSLRPEYPGGYYALAWVYSSCPDARFRDGRKGVEAATKACELANWKVFAYLDALGMAYAESGDFKKAIEWSEKAIAIVPDSIPMKDKEGMQARLELYKSGKPYRDDPRKK